MLKVPCLLLPFFHLNTAARVIVTTIITYTNIIAVGVDDATNTIVTNLTYICIRDFPCRNAWLHRERVYVSVFADQSFAETGLI